MTLAPSEIRSPLFQYPPGRYPPEDTTADSREGIEKKDPSSTVICLVLSPLRGQDMRPPAISYYIEYSKVTLIYI